MRKEGRPETEGLRGYYSRKVFVIYNAVGGFSCFFEVIKQASCKEFRSEEVLVSCLHAKQCKTRAGRATCILANLVGCRKTFLAASPMDSLGGKGR